MKNEEDPAFQSFSDSSEESDPPEISDTSATASWQMEDASQQPEQQSEQQSLPSEPPQQTSVINEEVIVPAQTPSSPADAAPTRIIIVGTAHVSEKSVREVQKTIEAEQPDIVAVELCPSRYKSITDPDESESKISFKEILKPGQIFYFLLYSFLSYLQKKMGEEMGVQPGSEMFAAIEAAKETNAGLALIDRDIQTTFKRFIAKMSFFEKVRLIFNILLGSLGFGEETEVDINHMTDQDVVTALIEEFRKFSPTAASVLIDERDAYLAGSILETIKLTGPGKKMVVVIGAGHRQGVMDYLHSPAKIPPLATLVTIPKKRFSLLKLISYSLIAFVFLLFAYIIYNVLTYPDMTFETLLLAFGCWFLINGVLSAGGVVLAGGRFKSAATAFLLAWFTSLNPLAAAGWFAGLVEAGIRKPTTKDMKNMMAVETFKELNQNPFFKVIFVAALANLGSVAGTFIGAYVVLQLSGINIADIIRSIVSGLI